VGQVVKYRDMHFWLHSCGDNSLLTAVCDLDRAKCDQVAAKYGVKAYYDLDDVIADEDIPVICLITGPVNRADLIRRTIRAGKDVMTTKPFELDAESSNSIARQAGMIISTPLSDAWSTGRPCRCPRSRKFVLLDGSFAQKTRVSHSWTAWQFAVPEEFVVYIHYSFPVPGRYETDLLVSKFDRCNTLKTVAYSDATLNEVDRYVLV